MVKHSSRFWLIWMCIIFLAYSQFMTNFYNQNQDEPADPPAFFCIFFKQRPFWGTPTSSCLCRWVTAVASGFEGKITSEPAATPSLSLGPVWRPVTTAKWLWMQAACLKIRKFHEIPPRSKVFMNLRIQMALFIWSIPYTQGWRSGGVIYCAQLGQRNATIAFICSPIQFPQDWAFHLHFWCGLVGTTLRPATFS